VFCEGAESWYLCHTRAVHNPFEFQKRDVERPYQRPIFSISPRLSKILVNLSGAKPNDILLDTFCGYGTILQEAILMSMDIRGIDIDEKCVEATKKNLKWLSKEYNIKINDVDDKIFLGDAKKLDQYFEENSIDAIATEPPLGPPLKKLPPTKIAERIIEDLEPLYYSSFQSFYKVLKPNKRISIVLPCIKTSTGKFVKFDPIELTREIGFGAIPLSLEHTTLIDAEMRHRVLREIYVFKKF
ncbi:MAG: DNA methyltransferase, partial [Euryarchaeota archaeon]|nr:DNA methyltransferase [Euryarchaeota archaeon]